jgi:hypothetical protein
MGNTKPFNAAVLKIIDALGGDRRTGKCLCPVHDDGQKPSLQVDNGDKVPVVVHCFGINTREHDREVIDHLIHKGLWPTSDRLRRASAEPETKRTPDDRRRYARRIWNGLRKSGREFAFLLRDYLNARAIEQVPETALITMPPWFLQQYYPGERAQSSDDPGMVLPVRANTGKLRGIHVVWLNEPLTDKRHAQPQRQSYGEIKGNFVELVKIDYSTTLPKLIIAEGPETAMAAMQLTGIPAIATGGKGFMKDLEPPRAEEYIICPDADDDGGSRNAAGQLAQKLVGSRVQIALPVRPKSCDKDGYDWNDALIDAGGNTEATAKLRDAILEAPAFDTVMTDAEEREIRLNALAAQKLDDPLGYEQDRAHVARDLGIRRSALDEEVNRRIAKMQEQQRRAPPPPPNMELLAASARKIIASEDVLDLFAESLKQRIAGEVVLAKLLYIAATSRLFAKPMNMVLKGPSSAGKSETRTHVLEFFPPEAIVRFTALSEKALLYMDDDFCHKVLSMGEALNPEEFKFQDYLLRELMSEGRLIYKVPQKVGNAMVTITIEKHGPVAFMVTTTRNSLNPENETRMLSLEVDDSAEQTRRVLHKIASIEGKGRTLDAGDLKPWHDYQRWLAAGETRVRVPFAHTLGRLIKDTRSVRLRRDFGQLLRAIKAHALLHREHCDRDAEGWIVATIEDDYAAIRELMADLLASAAELKMRRTIAETVDAVVEAQRGQDGARVAQIADLLKLDKSSAYRRLRAAEAAGYIVNREERKGRAARYSTEGPVGQPKEELLPQPEELRREYDAARSANRRRKAKSSSPKKPGSDRKLAMD